MICDLFFGNECSDNCKCAINDKYNARNDYSPFDSGTAACDKEEGSNKTERGFDKTEDSCENADSSVSYDSYYRSYDFGNAVNEYNDTEYEKRDVEKQPTDKKNCNGKEYSYYAVSDSVAEKVENAEYEKCDAEDRDADTYDLSLEYNKEYTECQSHSSGDNVRCRFHEKLLNYKYKMDVSGTFNIILQNVLKVNKKIKKYCSKSHNSEGYKNDL